jgi:hypothetical protein
VKNECNVLTRSLAVHSRKKVAFENGQLAICRPAIRYHLKFIYVTGWPGETNDIPKSAIHQILYHPPSDETGGTGHQDSIVWPNNKPILR